MSLEELRSHSIYTAVFYTDDFYLLKVYLSFPLKGMILVIVCVLDLYSYV
jgi:hypothetical protein